MEQFDASTEESQMQDLPDLVQSPNNARTGGDRLADRVARGAGGGRSRGDDRFVVTFWMPTTDPVEAERMIGDVLGYGADRVFDADRIVWRMEPKTPARPLRADDV